MADRLVLASGNPGKLRELAGALAPAGIELLPQSDFGVTPAAETGATFVENALLKARQASAGAGLPALADDSGLVVDALDGAPGLYSARYAGDGAADADNVARLLAEMANVPDAERGAHFLCVLVLLRHPDDPAPLIAEGRWRGAVAREPAGSGGFGYDPVFAVPGRGCSAAELDPADKRRISHRGQALAQLLSRLRDAD